MCVFINCLHKDTELANREKVYKYQLLDMFLSNHTHTCSGVFFVRNNKHLHDKLCLYLSRVIKSKKIGSLTYF